MTAFLRLQGAPRSRSLRLDEGRAMVRCGDHKYRILSQSADHLAAYGRLVSISCALLGHLRTNIDVRSEPMSRIQLGNRLPTYVRVDGRAILTKCGMKSVSKMDHRTPNCLAALGTTTPKSRWRMAVSTTPN
jgi:hypothetical protein